jgi:precorrin-6A/cobalt-precorrin-6A reductase
VTGSVLVLAGTAEARALARALEQSGVRVICSLAGRVKAPRLPVGEVRIGGFGGPAELARWLGDHSIAAVVDATHPFAERISASAAEASRIACVPLMRLERPGWEEATGDRWHWVDSLPDAADAIGRLGAGRVFLTTGRQGLAAFADDSSTWFLIRCVDPPDAPLPPRRELVLDRGPFTLAGELNLIQANAIDLLVTKHSGGPMTEAKLRAARTRGLAVVIVRRPRRPTTCPSVHSVTDAAAWVLRHVRPVLAKPDPAAA